MIRHLKNWMVNFPQSLFCWIFLLLFRVESYMLLQYIDICPIIMMFLFVVVDLMCGNIYTIYYRLTRHDTDLPLIFVGAMILNLHSGSLTKG